VAAAQRGDAIGFEPCDGPVSLAPGDHLVETMAGTTTGLDVDGVVLGSDASGEPIALGPGGSLADIRQSAARVSPRPPSVRVVDSGRTKRELEIRGARPGEPFWLVLGESNSAGWEARSGERDLGGSTLVNGFANGWQVVPPSANFEMTLEWTPQQHVWIALAISVAALVLCLVLVFWSRRRGADRDPNGDATFDGAPELASPLVAEGTTPNRRAVVIAVIGAGVLAALVARWWIGVIVVACVLAVLLRPRLRFLLSGGAVACVAATGLYVLVQQHRYDYPYDFFWVEHFDTITNVAWLAVLLLAADALIEVVRRRPT
jgi:arabinofuranan 3-O-arabinosyltransferase